MTVWRDGKTMNVPTSLAELPGDEKQAPRSAEGGAALAEGQAGHRSPVADAEIAQRLGVDGERGAVVTSVREGSPAQEAGVQEGDIVIEVDRKPVSTADDAVRALGADRSGGHLLRLRRGDGALFVVVPAA